MVEGAVKATLAEEQERLKSSSPLPMSTMFPKQSASEAIVKQMSRQQLSIKVVPATAEETQTLSQKRKAINVGPNYVSLIF